MTKIITRILSFCMCIVMLFSVASVGITAHAASTTALPVVYIPGRRTPIYNKDGKKIYPMDKSISDAVSGKMLKIVNDTLLSYTKKDWNILGDTLYDIIAPLYKEQVLDKNGNISNGTYIKPTPAVVDKDGKYTLFQYIFDYDCRIDPWESAARLRKYIAQVLAATGKKKVHIVGRCMGSDILAAYLVRYKNDTKVASSVFYAPACNGILINSAPFSGKIEIDAAALKRYLNSGTNSNSDEEFDGLLKSFSKILNSVSSNLGADIANSLFEQAGDKILPRLILATYGTMPGYWAMVSDQYYSAAKKYVFGKKTSYYAGLIKKIDYYHNNVQLKLPSVLKKLQKDGMKINIISKYNVAFDPIYEGCDQQGDGWIEVKNSSFGATAATYGNKLSASYLKPLVDGGLANYVSGDRVIDATTALFPDYTFFIKNCKHTSWPQAADQLVIDMLNSSKQYTIKSSSKFTQFMAYKGGNLVPQTNYKEVLNPTVKYVNLSATSFDYDGKVKTPSVTVQTTNGKTLKKDVDYKVTMPSGRKNIGTYTVKVKFLGLYKDIKQKNVSFKIVPANPTELKSSGNGTSITLSWTKVKGDVSYRVYRYNARNKTYTFLGETKGSSFKVKNLVLGKNYDFTVRSYKKVGDKRYFCSKYNNIKVFTQPDKPKVTASGGVRAATVRWNKVGAASGYQVYRATSKNGTYRRVKSTTSTSYTNSGLGRNKNYYYKVRAYRKLSNGKTLYGSFSSVVTAKTK